MSRARVGCSLPLEATAVSNVCHWLAAETERCRLAHARMQHHATHTHTWRGCMWVALSAMQQGCSEAGRPGELCCVRGVCLNRVVS